MSSYRHNKESNMIRSNDHKRKCSRNGNITNIKELHFEIIDNLYKFKNENLFTDISIYVEGVEFPCHKVILCAASSYFKAMFSCDLKESRLGKVYIENISPWTMKRLLDFIYTGKIEINYENVIDLFNAAVMFQLYKLAERCTDYIREHIDLNNCIEINLFACIHELKGLEEETFTFILDNFMQLININTSLSLSLLSSPNDCVSSDPLITNLLNEKESRIDDKEKDLNDNYSNFVRLNERTFMDLIKSDLLNVSREIYVYYAINKWIEHYAAINALILTPTDPILSKLYENMIKYVRFTALNRHELEFIINNDTFVKSSEFLVNKIRNGFNKSNQSIPSSLPSSVSASLSGSSSTSISLPSSSRSSPLSLSTTLAQNSLIDFTSMKTPSNMIRPSTLPRDYICLLISDQFYYYDIKKSKWDLMSNWPINANITNNISKGSEKSPSVDYCTRDSLVSNKLIQSFIFGNNIDSVAIPNHTNPYPSLPTENPDFTRLNGYSVCAINNVLYVFGGHLIDLVQSYNSSNRTNSTSDSEYQSLNDDLTEINELKNLQLVDYVYKFDPTRNEWTTCKSMPRKRAFHTSISISSLISNNSKSSSSQQNYIMVIYGIYNGDDSEDERSFEYLKANLNNVDPHDENRENSILLKQCYSIDVYNIDNDSWTTIDLNNNPSSSLVSHHLFSSLRQFNKNIEQSSQPDTQSLNGNLNLNNPDFNYNCNTNLTGLIEMQLKQSRMLISMNNLMYVLNENCIHCYEFDAKNMQLNCLPYFHLPISNLDRDFVGTAVGIKTPKSSETPNPFTWASDDDNESDIINSSEKFSESQIAEANSKRPWKKEALIYLLNPEQSIMYEFYPARNKLKKLPPLKLKHNQLDTYIINIKSRLCVTGGIMDGNDELFPSNSAIEVFDENSNSWQVVTDKVESISPLSCFYLNSSSQDDASQTIHMDHLQNSLSRPPSNFNQVIPKTKNYFKLKMSLV